MAFDIAPDLGEEEYTLVIPPHPFVSRSILTFVKMPNDYSVAVILTSKNVLSFGRRQCSKVINFKGCGT